MRALALLALASAAAAQGPLPAAELRSGDALLRWENGVGWTLSLAGTPLWSPVGDELVLHDPGWTRRYFDTNDAKPEVALAAEDGRPLLTRAWRADRFAATQRVTIDDAGRFVIEWTYRQDGWDAAGLQVGLGRPREEIWAGATFSSDRGDGTVPLTFQNGPAFGPRSEVTLRSLFATLQLATSRPVSLYDYANRNGHFWLGFDEPLPRGEERSFRAVFSVGAPNLSAGGVTIAGFEVPRRVTGGSFVPHIRLTRDAGGPDEVIVRVEVTDEAGETLAAEAIARPAAEPVSVLPALSLLVAGRYRVSITIRAGDDRLLAAPPLSVDVVSPLRVTPGLSLYTDQAEATLRARVAPVDRPGRLELVVGGAVEARLPVAAGVVTEVPIPLAGLPDGASELTCELQTVTNTFRTPLARATVTLRKAPPKPNTVVIDHATGGLRIDGVPSLPVGFYCDHPPLPEIDEDAQMGWTFVGPYVRRYTVDGDEHRARVFELLDRAHAAGLQVHYCLHGLAVGEESEEKFDRLRREIEAVRDHPALLGWYLADEPELNGVPPDRMQRVYDLVKLADPYHPCTMVFANRGAAVRYERALDISMTDPYPIPRSPAGSVAASIRQMVEQHRPDLAIWVVPQAFGGGEWWEREPSAREERVMTWLALIEGARGIQYFIRRAPNGNPVSIHLWNECRRLAAEVAELAPELLAPRTRLETGADDLHAALTQSDRAVCLLVANASPQPRAFSLALPGVPDGQAEAVFEQRTIAIAGERLDDLIDGYGTRAYRLYLGDPPPLAADEPGNLVRNASLEQWANVGTPDAYYMGRGSDPAASARVDRAHVADGRHSLRLVTPVDGGGMTMRPFPIRLHAGRRYRLSLQVRADRPGARVRLSLAGLDAEPVTAEVGPEWTTVELVGIAPEDRDRGQIGYSLLTAGMAWFDALRLIEEGE